MADVFLSYRNTVERRAFVKRLALLLRAHEISVWWDYGLEAGESYRAQITDELAKARIVAPLWCTESVASKWVKMEAELGKDKLVPARLQKVAPPPEFEAIQAADLIGWDGSVVHVRALAYVRRICERLGKRTDAPIDMMEELAHLPALAPLPEIAAPAPAGTAPGMDFVLADLRATWRDFPGKNDSAAVERFLAQARGRAPGSGLEFEIEEHLAALRTEAGRRSAAQDVAAQAERRAAEGTAAREEEIRRRRTPGAEFCDGEGLPLMVTLPTGKFLMGAPKNEEGRDGEEPQHQVRIEYAFALGKFAVTFAEWDAAIAAGAKLRKPNDAGWGRLNRPVIRVSWNDAGDYIDWLNSKLGLEGKPDAYRLSSEAEWEYACRAGTTTPFSFGATISTAQANYNGNSTYGGGKKGEYRQKTTPVGAFPENHFGFHDMHGNVWEWCADPWHANYQGAPADGSAWIAGGDGSLRVLRGGSWGNPPRYLRSAERYGDYPSNRVNNGGFRLARTL